MIREQTHPFGVRDQYTRDWSRNVSAVLEVMQGGAGIMAGARLNIPTSGDLLRPVGVDGWLVAGDQVAGPNLSELTDTAPTNVTMRRIVVGSVPYYYADASNNVKELDAIIGEISTSGAAIKAIGQPLNPTGGVYGLRGVINLAACDKGADVALANWLRPIIHGADAYGASLIKIESAVARMVTAAAGGTDINFKIGTLTNNVLSNAITVATIAAANTGTAGAKAVGTPGPTWILDPIVAANANLGLAYNVAAGPTAGIAEVIIHFRYL
jgi:hypothetical protein